MINFDLLRTKLDMLDGKPPYDTPTNICCADAYFAASIARQFCHNVIELRRMLAEHDKAAEPAETPNKCPFCETVDVRFPLRDHLGFFVQCVHCNAQGPHSNSPHNAARNWNWRR